MRFRSAVRWHRPTLESLEARLLLDGTTLDTALSFPLTQSPTLRVDGPLEPNAAQWYRLEITAPGVLKAELRMAGRLELRAEAGHLLVTAESDAALPVQTELDQFLLAGTYYLVVSAGVEQSPFTLEARYTHALPLQSPTLTGRNPVAVARGDLNQDGFDDLVVANSDSNTLGIFFGNVSGMFSPRIDLVVEGGPSSVMVVDVQGDHLLDLVVTLRNRNSMVLLTGQGDGSFASSVEIPVGTEPVAVAVADLDHNGRLDVVTVNQGSNNLSVLRQQIDGTFQREDLAAGFEPSSILIADVSGNGHLDLVVSIFQQGALRILEGDGTGSFTARPLIPVGLGPVALVQADLNGNSAQDLLIVDRIANTIQVLLDPGTGPWKPSTPLPVGIMPNGLKVADFNDDGLPDLVVTHEQDTLTISLGRSDGTLASPRTYTVAPRLSAVEVMDVNRDGRLDLVVISPETNELTVLLGNGDGSFQWPGRFASGRGPSSVALGDVNGDGHLDVISANVEEDSISIQIGGGDGTFELPTRLATGTRPTAVSVGDLNGDGRADLVWVSRLDGQLGVLLGNGNGTFLSAGLYTVGREPQDVIIADLDQDGILDLISADSQSHSVSILWGKGNGQFHPRTGFQVGDRPFGIATADVDGDGRLDLFTANRGSNSISILWGAGNRSFSVSQNMTLPMTGSAPVSVAVADVNRDGRIDLLVGTLSGTLYVVPGTGLRGFSSAEVVLSGVGQLWDVVTADVNRDGWVDLLSSDFENGLLHVLLNRDATGWSPFSVHMGARPISMAVGDLNGDRWLDVVTANNQDSTIGVALGALNAEETVTSSSLREVLTRNTPFLVDLNGDGIRDTVILDRQGRILYRPGTGIENAPFLAYQELNPGKPARDMVPIRSGNGWVIAAVDRSALTGFANLSPRYSITLYRIDPDFVIVASEGMIVDYLPTRIAAGDLTRSGRDSLILLHAYDARVSLILPGATAGQFTAQLLRETGELPTEVVVHDTNADGWLDVLISNGVSSDITLLRNDQNQSFTQLARYRTSPGQYGMDSRGQILANHQPVALAVGDFILGGGADLVVLHQLRRDLITLQANDLSGFGNPQSRHLTSTTVNGQFADAPGPMVAGDIDGDGLLDLLVLERSRSEVWIFRGQGDGTFEYSSAIPAGDSPGGLFLSRNDTTGFLDLLIGNSIGDVLILRGRGDGNFDPPPPFTGRRTSLSVRDASTVLVGNQSSSTVTIQRPTQTPGVFTAKATLSPDAIRLQAPGAVKWVKFHGKDRPHSAVILNTGGNSVVIYHGVNSQTFTEPRTYAVGTQPISLTVADLNEDGVPDLLVTNQGSNDVSVLFGQLVNGQWQAVAGPRIRSQGLAPIGTTLRDTNGDGRPDLIITNRQSSPGAVEGNLTVVPGRGLGFFDDRNPNNVPLPFIPVNPLPETPFLQGSNGGLFFIQPQTLIPSANLFGGGQILLMQPVSNNRVVAYLADNRVVELQAATEGDDSFVIGRILVDLVGVPSEPSALEVLLQEAGFQVLVTSAGSDRLFVFEFDATTGLNLPDLPESGTLVVTISAVEGIPLAVVVTLLAGGLSESIQIEDPRGGEDWGGGRKQRAVDLPLGIGEEDESLELEEDAITEQPEPSVNEEARSIGQVPAEGVEELEFYRPTEENLDLELGFPFPLLTDTLLSQGRPSLEEGSGIVDESAEVERALVLPGWLDETDRFEPRTEGAIVSAEAIQDEAHSRYWSRSLLLGLLGLGLLVSYPACTTSAMRVLRDRRGLKPRPERTR